VKVFFARGAFGPPGPPWRKPFFFHAGRGSSRLNMRMLEKSPENHSLTGGGFFFSTSHGAPSLFLAARSSPFFFPGEALPSFFLGRTWIFFFPSLDSFSMDTSFVLFSFRKSEAPFPFFF